MATVHCLMTRCRFNERRLCTLGSVSVGPGAERPSPSAWQPDGLQFIASHPLGYSSEFAGYWDMAQTQLNAPEDHAMCLSYAPR
ncbi:MAG: hypothetical protein K6U14_00090 [Firmicutes bacterium]|nr:hypothetical protein [Alicyclobacillaceae bacterium]MCL6496023.1 hypothetical protein [Bacillota bacterium]